MSFSVSARVRRGLARFLWPPAFEAAAVPAAAAGTISLPAGFSYAGDGMLTYHNSDFLADERFRRAYAAGKATGSWWEHDLHWRGFVVCWAAERGLGLDGDYVECGVNRGGFSRMLAEWIGLAERPDKRLWLVDTYCGIPARDRSETQGEVLDTLYSECFDEVVATFAPFPNAHVVRGIVPEVLPQVLAERVCYLSIDMNCVEPSIAAAERFWPLMSAGAVMVLDDYGFTNFRDQKEAFDLFAARVGVRILLLPTGQGLLIKP